MNNFNFCIPLKKAREGALSGIASTTSIDRDGERMSDQALRMMVDDIKAKGINLFGNHEHGWENILGGIDKAELNTQKQVVIGINPNKANPKYNQFIGTMSTPGVTLGLSVGGTVKGDKWEFDKALGKKVHVLDKVEIYEVSVVGIPSNKEALLSIPTQIMKSMKEKGCDKNCELCKATQGAKWESCVSQVRSQGGVSSPEAVCTEAVGHPTEKCPCCWSIMKKGICGLCFYKGLTRQERYDRDKAKNKITLKQEPTTPEHTETDPMAQKSDYACEECGKVPAKPRRTGVLLCDDCYDASLEEKKDSQNI